MLAFKHSAASFDTPRMLVSDAETSGGPISLHTAMGKRSQPSSSRSAWSLDDSPQTQQSKREDNRAWQPHRQQHPLKQAKPRV
jgi:hypothetical protein